VDYGQSQKFNFTSDTGYRVSSLLVDGVSQSISDSYEFDSVSMNHTIIVSFSSDSAPTQTPQQTASSSPSTTPQIQPTETPKNDTFPLQITLIALGVLTLVIILIVLAFRKGVISIEVVGKEEQEEHPQENQT
jgi:hypothetical protein